MTATDVASAAATWRIDFQDYVHVLQVAPDRSRAVAGSLGGDVALVDVNDGSTIALKHHEMGVLSAAWSADGERVAVGGQDGLVRFYDRTGASLGVLDTGAWVATMAWSTVAPVLAIGAGRHLFVADGDGSVLNDFDDQPSTVSDVAWSSDGARVGVAAYNGIGWYDVLDERAGRHRRFDWKGSLLALVVSPDGKWACAGAQDATVHLWKLWSGRELAMGGYPAKVERLAFQPEGRWLAVACLGELSVWDFGGGGPARTRPATGSAHEKHIEDLAWSPSGATVATGGGDGRVVVWPAPRKKGQDLSPLRAIEGGAAASRLGWVDDATLIVGRADGTVLRLDV